MPHSIENKKLREQIKKDREECAIPPSMSESAIKRNPSSLGLTLDIRGLDVFKDMLKVTSYLFQQADEDTQKEALKMMEDAKIIEVVRHG